MKLFHTADWNLGEMFYGNDREEENRHFLKWLLHAVGEQQADVLLLSGNIFSSPCTTSATERLFFDFLHRLTEENPGIQVVLTSGNRDASSRMESLSALFGGLRIHVRSLVPRNFDGAPDFSRLLLPLVSRTNPDDKAVLLAVPYLGDSAQDTRSFIKELVKVARKEYGKEMPLLLMANLRAAGATDSGMLAEQKYVDCRGLDKEVRYAALGGSDIDGEVNGMDNVRYAGRPSFASFSEKDKDCGGYAITLGERDVLERLSYQPLRALKTIPEEGAIGLDMVLRQLSKLPKGKKSQSDDYPYLEVKIAELHPTLETLDAILGAVSECKVHLCRILRVRPDGEVSEEVPDGSENETADVRPALLAHNLYKQTFKEDMPDDIACLFAQAKRETEAN